MLLPLEKPDFGVRFGGLPDINRGYDIMKQILELIDKEYQRVYHLPDAKYDEDPWRDILDIKPSHRLDISRTRKYLLEEFSDMEKILAQIRSPRKWDDVNSLKEDFKREFKNSEYTFWSVIDVFDEVEDHLKRKMHTQTPQMYKIMMECRSQITKITRAYNEVRAKLWREFVEVCKQQ